MLKIVRSRTSAERKITFSLPADHPAGTVSVVGNFNDWNPDAHRLIRRANGLMSASVILPENYIVNFRYLGEAGQWFDEPDATFVDAGASVLWSEPAGTRPVTKPAARPAKTPAKAASKAAKAPAASVGGRRAAGKASKAA